MPPVTDPMLIQQLDALAPANDPGFTGFIPGQPKPDDPPSGYIRNPDGSLMPEKGGPADPYRPGGELDPNKPAKDAKAAEAERKAAYLATNLTANINLMNQALKIDPSAAKPTWGQAFAGMFGDTAKNLVSPEQRQVVESSQRLITDAALTLGTGAAYTKEQIEAYRRGFFPQLGDSEAAIKAKREALRAALVAARIAAGGQAPKIDEAMAALGMDPNAAPAMSLDDALKTAKSGTGLDKPLSTPAKAAALGPNEEVQFKDEQAHQKVGHTELTDEQKTAYASFWQQNKNPTPEQLTAFLAGIGIDRVGNAADIIKAVKEGRGYAETALDTDYRSKVEQQIKQDRALGNEASPVETLRDQGTTLNLSDEASGVGASLANIITNPFTAAPFDPVLAYRVGRDAERTRIENARQQLGYGGTAIELASGLAAAGPGALATLAPKQAAVEAGKAGALGGFISGYGAGEGGDESAVSGAGGALAGYVLGRHGPALLERGASLLPRRFRAPRGMAPDLAAAAEAEGVDLIRPMVDSNAVSEFGALESNVYSQPIIRGAQARVSGQIEDRVEALGGGGTALEPGAAGERLQLAGNRYITRSKGLKDKLYRRAENLAGDTRFVPEKALEQVDQEIAQLSGNEGSNAAEINFLTTIRNDLAKSGGKTVAEIRNIREGLRGEIGRSNLTLSGAEARALRVLTSATEDIADAVPSAASAYKRADTFYRERQIMVDDIKRAILGKRDDPLDPQKAFANIKSLTSPGGNGRRLSAIMRNLEGGERQDIAATVAMSLGRRSADEPFSTALFLSQTRKLSPSARRTIFGPDGAQSIDNLRLLSRKLEEAGKDINRSRTATVLERQGWRMAARNFITTVAGLGGTAAAAAGNMAVGAPLLVGTAAMGASAVRRVLSARAMVNPRVSRWLAESADVSTPAQAKEATRKLGVIIAREPALANELQPIYEMLQQRLTMPLAAEPQPEGEDDER